MFDGATTSVHSNLAIGRVCGDHREVMAVVSPTATDDDVWRVVNLKSKGSDTDQFDSIAVLGAIDDDQAVEWAFNQRGRFLLDSIVLSVGETNTPGLKRYLDSERLNYRTNSQIHLNQLSKLQDMTTGQPVMWDGINLKSHSSSTAVLLVDLVKHDDNSQLFDAIKADDMPALLELLGAEAMGYDALIVESRKLDTLMQRLATAMSKATQSGVTVTNVRQSEPFKRNKVTQVAAIFEMSDGQSVSIVFHNPDSTPSKLLPQDTLISWKFLLNSRDISAAVQPNQGEDVQLPVLATRVMKLVNQNSARFARTNAKKAENVAALDEAKARIETKSQTVAALDAEIAQLQAELDKPVEVVPDPAVVPEPDSFLDGYGRYGSVAAALQKNGWTLSDTSPKKDGDVLATKMMETTVQAKRTNGEAFTKSFKALMSAVRVGKAETIFGAANGEAIVDYPALAIAPRKFAALESDVQQAAIEEFEQKLIRYIEQNGIGLVPQPTPAVEPTAGDLLALPEYGAYQNIAAFLMKNGWVLSGKNPEKEGDILATKSVEVTFGKKTFKATLTAQRKFEAVKDIYGAVNGSVERNNGKAVLDSDSWKYSLADQQKMVEEFEAALMSYMRSNDIGLVPTPAVEPEPTPEVKPDPTAAMRAGKMQAHLNQPIQTADGNVTTIGKLIDLRISQGGRPVEKSKRDPAAEKRLMTEFEALARNAPIGNSNHPDTIRLNELKAMKKDPSKFKYGEFVVTVPSYFLENADGGDSMVLTKTGFDYAQSVVANMPDPAPTPEEPTVTATNPDAEYLQSIVDGTADLSIAGDELERIGDNLPPELEALFEEAAEAYAQYAIGLEV